MGGSKGRWRFAGVLLAVLAVLSAGCTTDDRSWPFAFRNDMPVTVSVALQGPDGHKVVIAPSIAPGASWQGGSTDCRVNGTYVARDAAGRELAGATKYCGDPWVVDGRIQVRLINGLMQPATFVLLPASGPALTVAKDVRPHSPVSVDIAALGDPAVLCNGRLGAYYAGQASAVVDVAVTTCADWNWTAWPPVSPPASP
jgi:hypothetical protein